MNSTIRTTVLTVALGLSLLFAAFQAHAASYYVDFSAGSDANSGVSAAAAWKHSPGDPNASGKAAITLRPGDTVYFKGSVTYTDQINSTASGTQQTTGSNGSVTAAGVLTASGQSFTSKVQAGDWVYIWNGSTTGAWLGSVGLWQVKSVESDTQLTLANYHGAADSNANLTYIVARMVTYSSDSGWGTGAPIFSQGNQYAIQAQNYNMFTGLSFTQTLTPPNDGCTSTGYGCINGVTNSNMYLDAIINCAFDTVWSATHFGSANYFVYQGNTANNWNGILFYGVGRYALAERNTCANGCSTFRGFQQQSVLRYNTVSNATLSSSLACGNHANAFLSQGASDGLDQYGWIYANTIYNAVTCIQLDYNNGGMQNWRIVSNLILTDENNSTAIADNAGSNCSILNNTIVALGSGAYWSHNALDLLGTQTGSIVENNIVYGTASQIGATNIGSGVTGYTWDHNVYYTPNRSNGFEFNGTQYSFSAWQANSGADAHSSISEPLFSNVSGTAYTDVNLRPASNDTVLTNRGLNLYSTFRTDILGNPCPSAGTWNIGAYQPAETGTALQQVTGVRVIGN